MLRRLLVDQMLGLRAVALTAWGDVHARDQRDRAVRNRSGQLVPIKPRLGTLAPMLHLRIDRRDDLTGPGLAVQPRNAVLVDIEVLPDQIPQQLIRGRD